MSVSLMSLVYKAHFHDIEFTHKGKRKSGEVYEKRITVLNSNLKSVCLALADHANDEGEGAYPSVDKISSKTELSDVTVIACLRAMMQEEIISYVGRSKWVTCNYTINKGKLSEMTGWERQKRLSPKSKAALLSKSKAALDLNIKPLNSGGKAALVKPSVTILEPSERDTAIFTALSELTGGGLNTDTPRLVDKWIEKHPLEKILQAIEVAKEKRARSAKYVDEILIGWEANGYPKTREEKVNARRASTGSNLSVADAWLLKKEQEANNGRS